MVEILKLMLGRDSEDEIWSRFVFELVIWTQHSGLLCLWQCFSTLQLLNAQLYTLLQVEIRHILSNNLCHIFESIFRPFLSFSLLIMVLPVLVVLFNRSRLRPIGWLWWWWWPFSACSCTNMKIMTINLPFAAAQRGRRRVLLGPILFVLGLPFVPWFVLSRQLWDNFGAKLCLLLTIGSAIPNPDGIFWFNLCTWVNQ